MGVGGLFKQFISVYNSKTSKAAYILVAMSSSPIEVHLNLKDPF